MPCTELMIGMWRRVADPVTKGDLVVYMCEAKRCLTWFIHSRGFSFKMDIPFGTVVETKLMHLTRTSAQATFLLSQTPSFYLEEILTLPNGSTDGYQWKRCQDWTEGGQATQTLRHELVGSSPELMHLLRTIHVHTTSRTSPQPPSYSSDQLPLGPAIRSEAAALEFQAPADSDGDYPGKRLSCPEMVATSHSPDSVYSNDSDRPPPYSAPSELQSFLQQSFSTISSSCPVHASDNGLNQESPAVPAPYDSGPREAGSAYDYLGYPASYGTPAGSSYTHEPVPGGFYEREISPKLNYPCHPEDMDQSHSSANFPYDGFEDYSQQIPSAALLTTPYFPQPHHSQEMLLPSAQNIEHTDDPASLYIPV